MKTGPQEEGRGQEWGRQGLSSVEEVLGGVSEQHRSPELLSRKKRPEEEEGRKGKNVRNTGSHEASIRTREPRNQRSDPVNNYLKTIFPLAKRESFQGTGKRRRAARGRCQQ